MLKNFFKIAFRNLIKNKGFTAINIFGLALGLGCFVIIAMYVTDELSYDRFHENAENIYKINSELRFGGVEQSMAYSSDPMGPTLLNDYPEVKQYVRIYFSEGSKLIKKGNDFIKEDLVAYADSTLFKVFTFEILAGNKNKALTGPSSAIINESAAKRYFGSVDAAIGETLIIENNPVDTYKVDAVYKDLPTNSHFHFDFILPMANVQYDFGRFTSHNFHTYLLMDENLDYKEFNKKFDGFIDKYILPELQQYVQISDMNEFEKTGNKLKYLIMPLTDIHLKSKFGGEIEPGGNIQYVYIFSGVALFILLLACINFMNLTTARSAGRAKEVGIRKVLGTERKFLVSQFLSESIIIAFLAMFVALGLVWVSLDWFNTLAGKQMSLKILLEPAYLIFLLVLPLIVGAFAGFYPALFLSSFKPITVLKGKVNSGSSKDKLRSFLVVFQFSTSIALIIGTLVIFGQLRHIQNSDVGFNKEQVLIVDNAGIADQTRRSLLEEISQLTDIKAASFAGYIPVEGSSRSDTTYFTEAVVTTENGFSMQNWRVDYDYLSTMDMELVEGRNFDPSRGIDSTSIIVNEATVKAAGFQEPLGKSLFRVDGEDEIVEYKIIGVVKDFNYESLRENVRPLGMRLGKNSWASVFRFSTDDVAGLVNTIEEKYKKASTGVPFTYRFMDESFDSMYRQERRVGQIALTFAIIAIIIACLGLFGLATYIAEQRRKEIGIRKVLGASVSKIVTMLSVDFVKLILIAFAIATPLAWWGMDSWLQDFAYRIDVDWTIFVLTGLIAMAIAIITLSFQAIKAAISNPVKSLRTE
ncbi:MAG: FtsX-like permease family protein [Flavobacteriaceae bacterium]|nr:FtsX-like permease family protein [Flavobacteriaceae bacterium]